jgi:hypothetical protein
MVVMASVVSDKNEAYRRQPGPYHTRQSSESESQMPQGPRWPFFGNPKLSYYTDILQRAWTVMEKVSVYVGPVHLQLPRLHTSGPAAVFGFIVLGACVIGALFFLMDHARAITNACIRWQLAQ